MHRRRRLGALANGDGNKAVIPFVGTGVGRLCRRAPKPLGAALAFTLALAFVPQQAAAQSVSPQLAAAIKSAGGDRDIRAFYKARQYRPLWVRGSGLGPEADMLLELIETAHVEGLDPDDYQPRAIASAIDRSRGGSPKALAKADMLLSRTFANYVRDVRRPADVDMVYVDRELAPSRPNEQALLQAAASAPSLMQHLSSIGWMHPIYGKLRTALASGYQQGGSSQSAKRDEMLRVNLERARTLPTSQVGRYVLVDTASQRLWMYQNGRVQDSMRVVVGKSSQATPMMAGLMRYTLVNPYWNLPPDLVPSRVAQPYLKQGIKHLKAKRFEVLSDWSDNPRVLDPKQVDWKAVAAGRQELPVRQLPGKDNAMGQMKFMFPNDLGIYLHDTPERELLKKADRRFSSGCVRLEDAPRLAKWLYGKPLTVRPGGTEKRVDLEQPVPVYITYLTAMPEGQTIVYRSDVYNRDGAQLASLGMGRRGAR
jgi:murein L,D-transpeptidase YcbB/YkuD